MSPNFVSKKKGNMSREDATQNDKKKSIFSINLVSCFTVIFFWICQRCLKSIKLEILPSWKFLGVFFFSAKMRFLLMALAVLDLTLQTG